MGVFAAQNQAMGWIVKDGETKYSLRDLKDGSNVSLELIGSIRDRKFTLDNPSMGTAAATVEQTDAGVYRICFDRQCLDAGSVILMIVGVDRLDMLEQLSRT